MMGVAHIFNMRTPKAFGAVPCFPAELAPVRARPFPQTPEGCHVYSTARQWISFVFQRRGAGGFQLFDELARRAAEKQKRTGGGGVCYKHGTPPGFALPQTRLEVAALLRRRPRNKRFFYPV